MVYVHLSDICFISEVNEPEEEDQQRKRRKVANKSLQSMEKTTKPKLFDESEDW